MFPNKITRNRHSAFSLLLLSLSVISPVATINVSHAQDAKLGREIWLTKANCRDCHGWSGDGVGDIAQAPQGANLRATKLSPDDLATTIKCGRPGTPMPYFDRFAYTDTRCYGVTAKDLGDQTPGQAQNTLIAREVDALVAYLQTFVIGKGEPTFEQCVELWGAASRLCPRYPHAR